MALISARTILTSISLFHVTLAFFFLTSPGTIADQAIVFVIGEAMGLVRFLLFSCLPCLPVLGLWASGRGRDATVASGLDCRHGIAWGGVMLCVLLD